jgi:penicillin-binding protein 1A
VIYGDTPKSDVLENKDMEDVAISQEQQNPSVPMPQLEQANQDLVVKSGGQVCTARDQHAAVVPD